MKQKETIKTDSEIIHDICEIVEIPDFSKFRERTAEVVKLAWEIVSKEYPLITLEGPNVIFRDQSVDFLLWAMCKKRKEEFCLQVLLNFSRASKPLEQIEAVELLRKACMRIRKDMEMPMWMLQIKTMWLKLWRR